MIPPELPKERGSAKYFHGRDDILDSFKYQLETVAKEERGGGSTFLVQGPPGAGKTALLSHCRNLATLHGWQTARIEPVTLWDTSEMRDHLGRKWYDSLKRVKIGGEIVALPIALSVDFGSNATSSLQMIKGKEKGRFCSSWMRRNVREPKMWCRGHEREWQWLFWSRYTIVLSGDRSSCL